MAGYGAYIRAARDARRWNQETLADRLSVSIATISNLEREVSSPNPDQFNRLVLVLGLSPETLLDKMGYQLSPPGAARLPRNLVQALLRMTPDELDALSVLLERRARQSHSGAAS